MSQSPKNLSHLQLEQLEDRQMLSTVSIFVSGSDLPVRLVTKYNPDGSVDTNFASGNPFGDGTIGITGPFSLINASFTPDNHILIAGDRFIDGGRVTVATKDSWSIVDLLHRKSSTASPIPFLSCPMAAFCRRHRPVYIASRYRINRT